MGNQCCVDSKKGDVFKEYDDYKTGRKRNIRKDKELASGAGMGDDPKTNENFSTIDINGMTKSDRDTIASS